MPDEQRGTESSASTLSATLLETFSASQSFSNLSSVLDGYDAFVRVCGDDVKAAESLLDSLARLLYRRLWDNKDLRMAEVGFGESRIGPTFTINLPTQLTKARFTVVNACKFTGSRLA